MGRILIISDSHFLRKEALIDFIEQFDDLEGTIHCGDIYFNYQSGDIHNFYICKGNNDFAPIPPINHFKLAGLTFTTIHGNQNYFAYEPETLKTLLKDYPADVICFGHSHVPYFYQDEDVMILNPGSLSLSRTYPKVNTYALLDPNTKEVTFYDVETHEEVHIKR